MVYSTERRATSIRYIPGRLSIIGTAVAAAACWLLVLNGTVKIISVLPRVGWLQGTYLALLGVSPLVAIWTTRQLLASRRIQAKIPRTILEQRWYGALSAISDSEQRQLRSIGASAVEVATRTEKLFAELANAPSVRIFRGVHAASSTMQPIAHAITSGRTLLLIESVAWPPGQYEIDEAGQISCDGRDIGQCVASLMTAVRHWRHVLPRSHRVGAIVIVHRNGDGAYNLPADTPAGLTWTFDTVAASAIVQRIPRNRNIVSRHILGALFEATALPS